MANDKDVPDSEDPKSLVPSKYCVDRRKLLSGLTERTPRSGGGDEERPPVGIAFSGGGIRSATISLGMTAALARRGRLYGFDYMSTVSGGGYFGSFLRSLFLPQSLRGQNSGKASPKEIASAFHFADKALTISPSEKTIEYAGGEMRHPVRWLREHGRYLAPNGSADFAAAISYIARNWVAMLFVFAVGMAAIYSLLLPAMIYVRRFAQFLAGYLSVDLPDVTPFVWPAALCLFISLATGAAYWMTRGLSYNPDVSSSKGGPDKKKLWWTAFWISVMLLSGGAARYWLAEKLGLLPLPTIADRLYLFGLAILASGLVIFVIATLRVPRDRKAGPGGVNVTAWLRRSLLKTQTVTNQFLLTFLILALIDLAAVAFRQVILEGIDNVTWFGWSIVALQPALAFLIKKLPDWFGGEQGGFFKWVQNNVSKSAFVLGAFLFGLLAVMVNMMVHMALWFDDPWTGAIDWSTYLVFFVTVAALTVMTGLSQGFINLSSLHALYASRLTRAYLGATNHERLDLEPEPENGKQGEPIRKYITGNYPADHINTEIYQKQILAAPFHLINLTINDTFSDENLIAHERKGRRLVVGYDGIKIDGVDIGWTKIEKAEKLNVGQLCAISGAAASSGMGRRTTLGTALALTYANVRLGYWWDTNGADLSGGTEITQKSKRWWSERLSSVGNPFATFFYLYSEMTARYSMESRSVYLTDGGHSENSGALALIEENCQTILVADNGQDAKFEFADLEIFIRTARIDMGYEVQVASKEKVAKFCGVSGIKSPKLKHFLNMANDWRSAAREKGSPEYVLLLEAHKITRDSDNPEKRIHGLTRNILWFKPMLFKGLPADILSYSDVNRAFPQQTTADQFFDEAQWESYRRIGYEMIAQLFDHGDEFIPSIPAFKVKTPLRKKKDSAKKATRKKAKVKKLTRANNRNPVS
ncbi:MAG: hypothetical protein V3V15_11475 [Sphingorhabdus sp.]